MLNHFLIPNARDLKINHIKKVDSKHFGASMPHENTLNRLFYLICGLVRDF